jgi:hypothetical protein
MTAIAVFDILTDVSPEIINQNLNNIWIGQEADAILFDQKKMVNCSLMYFYSYVITDPEHIESVRNVVDYLLSISKNGLIYYYPDYEVYTQSGSDDDEAMEISIDDIFTEEYEPSLNSPFGYARFIIKKQQKNILTNEN